MIQKCQSENVKNVLNQLQKYIFMHEKQYVSVRNMYIELCLSGPCCLKGE